MSPIGRVAIAMGAALVCLLGGVGYAITHRSAKLVVPATFEGATVSAIGAEGSSMLQGALIVCLDRPGEVRVKSVTADAGNAEVVSWLIREKPAPEGGAMIGTQAGSLGGLRTQAVDRLTSVCDPATGRGYELVVETRIGAPSVTARGFRVDYKSGRTNRSMTVPVTVVLCDEALVAAADCRAQGG